MSALPRSVRTPHALAAFGGIVYAAVLLWWLSSRGLYFPSPDPVTLVVGMGYCVTGLFLMSAVPLYLLARFSLVTPVAAKAWILATTVYQHFYGTHLHPLSSYLIVWPLLFGMAVVPGAVEALVRLGLDREFDRFGLRPLV